MAETTKHPHYIYRYYLRAWASNEQIYCLRERKSLFPANLMKVGQENSFYEFSVCTDEEIAIGFYHAQNGCERIMEMYQCINNELKNVPPEQMRDVKGKAIIDFAKQCEETHFNCKIEERLQAVLPCLYQKKFNFLEEEAAAMEFFHSIAEQYCRTKKMKEGTNSSVRELNNPNIRGHNVWLLIRHSLAFKMGLSFFNNKYQVCLLENVDGDFITSDQPVINFHADYGRKIPEEVELYYPISPELALVISKKVEYPDRTIVRVTRDDVMVWNERMVEASYNQLFSNRKDILEKYIVSGSK